MARVGISIRIPMQSVLSIKKAPYKEIGVNKKASKEKSFPGCL